MPEIINEKGERINKRDISKADRIFIEVKGKRIEVGLQYQRYNEPPEELELEDGTKKPRETGALITTFQYVIPEVVEP